MKNAADAPEARLVGFHDPGADREPCIGCGGALVFVLQTEEGGHPFPLRSLLEALVWMREAEVFPDLGGEWWTEVRGVYRLPVDANGSELREVVARWKAAGTRAWSGPHGR